MSWNRTHDRKEITKFPQTNVFKFVIIYDY